MVKISETDLSNLNDLFKENYYCLKEIKNIEKKRFNYEDKIMLKKIRELHEDNLNIVLKLLDTKERFL